jgi:hypothetical protein
MRKLSQSEMKEYDISKELMQKVQQWLSDHAHTFFNGCDVNTTELAEHCAAEFDRDEWLDDSTHPLWEWAVEAEQEFSNKSGSKG